MDLGGIGTNYTDYYAQMAQNASASKLSSKLSAAGTANAAGTSSAEDEKLMDVCKQFESYLLEQVFKNMDKTVMRANEDDSPNGNLVNFFKEQTIQTLATQSTEQSPLGLAQMLYEQLKRNLGIDPNSISPEALSENAASSGAVTESNDT